MKDEEGVPPMDDARSEHPDEGTIHAWLDGALGADSAQALSAHVATCRECAERVAEARGLIAGASRVVRTLDDAPAAAGPAWGQAPATPTSGKVGADTAWRMLRVTPARAAIAATLLVAVGVSLTYRHAAVDTEALRTTGVEKAMQSTDMREERSAAASAPAAPAIRPRDALLDSAVARNVAKAQPPRVLKAMPGPAMPVPELAAGAAAIADRTAPTRVAVGRAAMQAQRESTAGVAPDQSVAGRAAGRIVGEGTVAAAKRADSVASPAIGVVAASAPLAQARIGGVTRGAECYRVETASGAAATWGTAPLPLVVAMDASRQGARVLTPAGRPTEVSATVTRAGDDSLLFRLRRLGYEGTLALGAAGEARAGVMRSRPLQLQLESVVTTAAPTADDPAANRAARRVAPQRRIPAARDSAAASAAESGISAAPAVAVVARRVGCP
jgi:hypothetical protein